MKSSSIFLCALAVLMAAALLQDAQADGIKITAPSDIVSRISETCNSSCVSSCNATWNAYAKWFKDDLSSDDAKKCDVCAMAYYAQVCVIVDVGVLWCM